MKLDNFNIHFVIGGENITNFGKIANIVCENCDFKSITLELTPKDEFEFDSILSLTDLNNNRILVTRYTYKEYNYPKEELPVHLEHRINNIYNVQSFKFFEKKYFNSDVKIFTICCPKCSSQMRTVKYQSFEEYVLSGGMIIGMDCAFEINNWKRRSL